MVVLPLVPVTPVSASSSSGWLYRLAESIASARRPCGTRINGVRGCCSASFANASRASVTTATAPCRIASAMKREPSTEPPRMATNNTPLRTSRESNSTALTSTLAGPARLTTSTPYRICSSRIDSMLEQLHGPVNLLGFGQRCFSRRKSRAQ